jgi:hypothetical protein
MRTIDIKIIARFLAVIMLAIVEVNCDHSTQNKVEAAGDIFPLKVGNSWNYTRTWTRLDSVVVDSVTMVVRSRDTVLGVSGYNVDNLIIGPVFFLEMYMLDNRSDGLYYVLWALMDPPSVPVLSKALPFPTHIGEVISFHGYTITTESINDKIMVPAGTYDCIKYVARSDTVVVGTIWSKPDLGPVQTWAKYGLIEYTHQLNSFSIQ